MVTEHTINQQILCLHQGSVAWRYISHFNKTAQPNSKPTDLPFQHTGKIRNCAKISAVSDSEYGKLAGP